MANWYYLNMFLKVVEEPEDTKVKSKHIFQLNT